MMKIDNDDSSTDEQEHGDTIDPITVLQDGIDSLSLAMFDALRQLRDAVAPESGHLGQNNGNNTEEHAPLDADELWKAFQAKDPDIMAMISSSSTTIIKTRDDLVQWHATYEMDKDTALVTQLAATVLEKSRAIDLQVQQCIPGMHRTRAQQVAYIQQLIDENAETARELNQVYHEACQQRDVCRAFVQENTCRALGMDDDDADDVFL